MLTVTVMVHTARTRPFSSLNISRIHMMDHVVVLLPEANSVLQNLPISLRSKFSATQGEDSTKKVQKLLLTPTFLKVWRRFGYVSLWTIWPCWQLTRFTSVSGMNFVAQSAAASRRPSVGSMSLGGGASTTLDNAVASVSRVSDTIQIRACLISHANSLPVLVCISLWLLVTIMPMPGTPLLLVLPLQTPLVRQPLLMLALRSPTSDPWSTSSLPDRMSLVPGLAAQLTRTTFLELPW